MKPIQIHPQDTEEQARARHEQIIARLEELGPERVKLMEFPTQWNLIIGAWLKGEKLDDKV